MRFLIGNLAGIKGLYQMVRQIVSLSNCLVDGKLKFNVRCFKGAAKRGYEDFFIGLFRIAYVGKGFV